ncbi:MAG: Lrp/AsnC ligand binding domain-containing protein [Candidatus Helarchaeota archaeon]
MTTILWGIIPWPYYYLEAELKSVLMITFIRVLVSTIFGFCVVFIFIVINRLNEKYKRFNWFTYDFVDLKINITGFLPLKTSNENNKKIRIKFPYIIYYFILGLCYFFSILFYFLSYQFLGVIFSAIMNTVIVTIIIAGYNLLRNLEKLDIIKISYLSILIIAGILTIASSSLEFSTSPTIFGLASLGFTIIFWFFFIIISSLDDFTIHEKNKILGFMDRSTNYQLVKSLVKVSFFFLFSLVSLIVFVIIYPYFPVKSEFLINEINMFILELKEFPKIMQNVWTWAIGIECTILPYIIYFESQNNWPSRSLRWDQWVAILAIFEPITSIIVGWFIGNETNYNIFLLSTSILLMIIVMILRYYHEKNSIKTIILLKIKQNKLRDLIFRLKYNPNITEIKSITGEYDLVLRTFFSSYHRLKKFLDRLKQLDSVIELNYHIETILKA